MGSFSTITTGGTVTVLDTGETSEPEVVQGNDTLTNRELRTWDGTVFEFLRRRFIRTQVTFDTVRVGGSLCGLCCGGS